MVVIIQMVAYGFKLEHITSQQKKYPFWTYYRLSPNYFKCPLAATLVKHLFDIQNIVVISRVTEHTDDYLEI